MSQKYFFLKLTPERFLGINLCWWTNDQAAKLPTPGPFDFKTHGLQTSFTEKHHWCRGRDPGLIPAKPNAGQTSGKPPTPHFVPQKIQKGDVASLDLYAQTLKFSLLHSHTFYILLLILLLFWHSPNLGPDRPALSTIRVRAGSVEANGTVCFYPAWVWCNALNAFV